MNPLRRRVLVSVYNKSGLETLAQIFNEHEDEVFSTGGTAQALRQLNVKVKDVSELTGFPEVMDGRVKTLHPYIHMGLLARKDHEGDLQVLKDFDVEMFDVVVGNLYDFESGIESGLAEDKQIELIDVGGPSFLRAAAKSFNRIDVVCDPQDYELLRQPTDLNVRKSLAAKVFLHTSYYDAQIAHWLRQESSAATKSVATIETGVANNSVWPKELCVAGKKVQDLRYGENPQQQAAWYAVGTQGLQQASVLQGKELSYNNILDLQSAVETLREFSLPAVVSLKHTNPCGVSENPNFQVALEESLAGDPTSVFGGIVALNQEVGVTQAQRLSEIFLECIVAPGFSEEALQVFAKKKNLRLLSWPQMMENGAQGFLVRSVLGGFLVQTKDRVLGATVAKTTNQDLQTFIDEKKWQVHGQNPTEEVWRSLCFAWKVCAHLKSNAIAIISGTRTVGLGMGQVSRIDSMEQAFARIEKYHPQVNSDSWSQPLVLASDAFFPFSDSIEFAARHGVKWVIQPGGSIKDAEVISKARELGVNMIFTGVRHFKH